jgi:hypothetical protein
MKPAFIAAVAVVVTATLLAIGAGLPAYRPRTSRDGLMPQVEVVARAPRVMMDEIIIRAERNPHVAGAASLDSGLN